MKKRVLSALLALILVLTLVPMAAGAANGTPFPVKDGNLYYEKSGGEITITDADKGITKADIPTAINGARVTAIDAHAIEGCDNLTSVTLPDCITYIGEGAFASCASLESIVIPEGVMSISSETFRACGSLGTVTIPEGVTAIGSAAFDECDNLTDVYYHGSQDDWSAIDIADGNDPLESATIHCIGSAGNDVIDSGTCGDNLTWTLEDDGTLTVSGSGAMDDYTRSTAPWYNDCDKITFVIVEDDVTGIGDDAFWTCGNITGVKLADSITSIGNEAFACCYGLTKVYLPSGLTAIKPAAFTSCRGLRELHVYSDVTTIGAHAFYDCGSLANVYYDGSLTQWDAISVGDGNDDLENAVLHWNNGGNNEANDTPYPVEGGNIYYKESGGAITITGADKGVTGADIPATIDGAPVTGIDSYVFSSCESLKSVTIPEGVTSIGEGAFSNCGSLKAILIPESVTSIGDYAFDYCGGLESITLPAGSLTSIGDGAFAGCSSLATLTIPTGVTTISNYLCQYCDSLTTLTIPEGVTSIGEAAFSDCGRLGTVTMPASVQSIGYQAFILCEAISDVYYGGTQDQWNAISFSDGNSDLRIATIHFEGNGNDEPSGTPYPVTGGNIYYEKSGDTITITDADKGVTGADIPARIDGAPVTAIGDYAFNSCESLMSVTIPEGVTSIGVSAFGYCYALSSVTIPEGVTSIGSYAFTYCSSLTSFTVPEGVTYLNEGVFEQCNGLTSVTLPESLTAIDRAFYSCDALTDITIPGNVNTIGMQAFAYSGALKTVTLPKSVTSIGEAAFQGCDALTDVYYTGTEDQWNAISINTLFNDPLGSAAKHFLIAGGTFGDGLTWVLYDNGSLTISGTGAMWDPGTSESPWSPYREKITDVVIEKGVTTIGSDAFSQCGSLTCVTIPDSVTAIDSGAFQYCTSLASLTIPDSVTSIGNYAFCDCDALTGMTLPKNLTVIAPMLLSQCDALEAVTIPKSVTAIGEYAFDQCSALEEVTIPKSVTAIGDYAFDQCTALTDVYYGGSQDDWHAVTIGAGKEALSSASIHYNTAGSGDVTWKVDGWTLTISGSGPIPDYDADVHAPWYDSRGNIMKLVIEDGVTAVGDFAFCDFCGIDDVTLPDTVTRIGNNAFEECNALDHVTIPSGVTSIGNAAFHNCYNLRDMTLPNSVTSLGEYAFQGCSLLQGITIPASVTDLGGYAFQNCMSLQSVTIQGSIPSIGVYAFDGCASLQSVTIQGSLTSVGAYAFRGCTALQNITLPAGTTSIGEYAFRECTALKSIKLPTGLTSLAPGVFYKCSGLQSIKLPDGMTEIMEGAFCECSGLTSIAIPVSVTTIGDLAFIECDNLKDVYYSGTMDQWRSSIQIGMENEALTRATIHCRGNGEEDPNGTCGDNLTWVLDSSGTLTISGTGDMYDYEEERWAPWFHYGNQIVSVVIEDGATRIGNCAFYDCDRMTSVTIPDSVGSIGMDAFFNCNSLTSITIPVSVTSIDISALTWCGSLKTISVARGNPSYSSNNGVLFSKDKTTLLLCPQGKIGNYTIPGTVKTIGTYAFCGCKGLTGLTIPDSVVMLERYAFLDCSGLTSLTIPAGISNIDEYAFMGCTGLTRVTFSPGSTFIGVGMFCDCTGLTRIDIPVSVKIVASAAFYRIAKVDDVYYAGSQDQWNEIQILDGNEGLTSGTIHYDSDNPGPALTVTFDANNGTPVTEVTGLSYGDKVARPANPVYEGYTFMGWYYGDKVYDFNTPVTHNLTLTAHWREAGGGGGGGSSSSSSSATNPVSTGTSEGGTVKANAANAKAGDTVTLTVTPDAGYQVEKVTVVDKNGNVIPVTQNADGTYSFTMPATPVTITPVFEEITPQPGGDVSDRFSDVAEDAWYHDSVQWAVDKGIMNGVSEDTFDPDGTATRAMVVTMLWRLAGEPEATGSDFGDVTGDSWYADAVAWAAGTGAVNGMSPDTFAPDAEVTREQLATILYRYAQAQGKGFTGAWAFPLDYPDAADVSDYAYEALCWMTMNGIIQGMDDGTLAPNADTTRAQIATMFQRFDEVLNK